MRRRQFLAIAAGSVVFPPLPNPDFHYDWSMLEIYWRKVAEYYDELIDLAHNTVPMSNDECLQRYEMLEIFNIRLTWAKARLLYCHNCTRYNQDMDWDYWKKIRETESKAILERTEEHRFLRGDTEE